MTISYHKTLKIYAFMYAVDTFMRDEEKAELIKVLEVIDYHLMVQDPDFFDNTVLITEADLSHTGLNFYQFGRWLGHLQMNEYITINEALNQKVDYSENSTADEMFYLEHRTHVVFHIELKNDFSSYFDELRYGKIDTEKIEKLNFDTEKSILHINSHQVQIALRKEPNNAHQILAYIFSSQERMKDRSDYIDIAIEKFDSKQTKSRTIWKACKDVQTKIHDAVGIPDFLVFSYSEKGNVCINSKYLPESLG